VADIFYFRGAGSLYLEPISMSLVPEKPDLLYCLDNDPEDLINRSPNGCWEISLEDDCSYKSYTVSDHLGLELNFDVSKNNIR